MKRPQIPISTFALFLSLFAQIRSGIGLVVSVPGLDIETSAGKPTQSDDTPASPLSLRLRSARQDDVNAIASLLASSTVDSNDSKWNWKTTMNVLRSRAAFHDVLSHRLKTLEEGKRAAAKMTINNAFSDVDQMRMLWSHDSFRTKVEKAVTMATEPHIWKDHNFCVCPEDPNTLRHAMITAEDSVTGSIVGFCEVAMMALPSCYQHQCTSTAFAPTVANLATCPHHRRQGIASSLLNCARRYVSQEWSLDKISLYVEETNKGAIALYDKQGFRSNGPPSDGDRLYMTQSIRTTPREQQVVAV